MIIDGADLADIDTRTLRTKIHELHAELMRRAAEHQHVYPPQLGLDETAAHLGEIVAWAQAEPNGSHVDHLGIYARRLVELPGWPPGMTFSFGDRGDGLALICFSARYEASTPAEFTSCAACDKSLTSGFRSCPWSMKQQEYAVALVERFGPIADRWRHGDEAGGISLVIRGTFPRLRAAAESNRGHREIDLPPTWRERTIPSR